MNERGYTMPNGMVLKTKNSAKKWCSFEYEILHVTRRGQYWIEKRKGDQSGWYAEYMDTRAAARWLVKSNFDLEPEMEGLLND